MDSAEWTDNDVEMAIQVPSTEKIYERGFNAGRDVLMCRTEEEAYDNLSEAINDRSIEQFLEEVKDDIL